MSVCRLTKILMKCDDDGLLEYRDSSPWWRKQYASLKRRSTSTGLRGAVSQKSVTLIFAVSSCGPNLFKACLVVYLFILFILSLSTTSWNTRRCSGFKIKWKIKPNWTTNTTRLNSPRHSHTHTHTHTHRVTHTLIQTRELNSANDFNGFNGLYRLPFWKAPFWN
jgi:hypothetical protein